MTVKVRWIVLMASLILLGTLLTSALSGGATTCTATVPYAGGAIYFALRSQNQEGVWSALSNNAFWPRQDVFLPLVQR